MNTKQYLSVTEAAKLLKRSGARIRQWIDEGRLPAIKIGPNWAIPAETCRRPKKRDAGRPKLAS